ncbi:MAG TPA: DEAD/DEAH box helicase, partial [Humisphaera sp.]
MDIGDATKTNEPAAEQPKSAEVAPAGAAVPAPPAEAQPTAETALAGVSAAVTPAPAGGGAGPTDSADRTPAGVPAPSDAPPADGFGALGLDARIVAALEGFGYEEPTPIQKAAIPAILTGRDVIGQADTGTGKTAAFALPMLQRIAALGANRRKPSAIVLTPTRELAMQVAEAMHKYGRPMGLTVVPVYGGHSFSQQHAVLRRGVDVVVATPGRAVDHLRRGTMDLSGLLVLALDEADEMLDMGFADELEAILSETPKERQTVFFSATLPPRIATMARTHLRDPQHIRIAKAIAKPGAAPKVRQVAYIVPRQRKVEALGRILDLENPTAALIFCRMRHEVDTLTERLGSQGYRAQALHGGITQDQRSRVVQRLRAGQIDLVVATDVAARGLDIPQLALVVNYDVPATTDDYVHRIGRVGRAGREGTAITLVDPRESRLIGHFERVTKARVEIAQVPTVADLRAKRLEMTRTSVQEAIIAGGLDRYRVAVESLAQEHDLMAIALAAFKLAHQAAGGDKDDGGAGDEEEEDAFAPRPPLRTLPPIGPAGARPPVGAKPPVPAKPPFPPKPGIAPKPPVRPVVAPASQAGVAPRQPVPPRAAAPKVAPPQAPPKPSPLPVATSAPAVAAPPAPAAPAASASAPPSR